MAIEFDLSIATEVQPGDALSMLSQGLNMEWTSEKKLLGPGVIVGAIRERPIGQDTIEEAFGFRPTIDVWFRIYPKQEYKTGKRTVLRTTMKLLRQLAGDAVLLYNGEELVLQRIGGKLQVNKDWGIWNSLELAELTLPYQASSLRSPLL